MPPTIRPLTEADLKELGAFLAEGFHVPGDTPFAQPDVLRWKYLDPCGTDASTAPRSYLARDPQTGRIVGHLGLCRGRFSGIGLPPEGVSTLHMIDWLASKAGTGVGATLMHRVHQGTETQFGFGGSAAGRGVGDRGGYALLARVPVFHNVLRPLYRLRTPGQNPVQRALWAVKDTARKLVRRAHSPRVRVEWRHVEAFGQEVEPILAAYRARAIMTARDPDRLNHILHYPKGGITGWHLLFAGRVCGFAVLAIVPKPGHVRVGKVVDCVLDVDDDALWHAALMALTRELKGQGADLAIAYASTEWTARALRAAGYAPMYDLEFRLRDRAGKIPRDAPFHLTPLEADYAYT
jgi:hypothetical protein